VVSPRRGEPRPQERARRGRHARAEDGRRLVRVGRAQVELEAAAGRGLEADAQLELARHAALAPPPLLPFEGRKNMDPEVQERLSFSHEDLRGGFSIVKLLTSLKQRRPPTESLIRRKFDALSRSAVETLPRLVEIVLATKQSELSPHQRGGVWRAVRSFPAETAAESAHVHACGAVASDEAVGFARDQASHMLRIGLEHQAAARRKGIPLCPVATDLHVLAMGALVAKGGEDGAKAALEALRAHSDPLVLDDQCFVSAAGLLIGVAFCVAAMDQGCSLGDVCCGSCHKVVGALGETLSICRRCGDHLFCEACLAGDGQARHASECRRVRTHVWDVTQLISPHMRESVRRVAVVQLNDFGLVVPMHISSVVSPLIPSSLLEALYRSLAVANHSTHLVVFWRLMVSFLVEPEGDDQELIEHEGVHRVEAATYTEINDRVARKAPTLLPSEKRRLRKERRVTEQRAKDDAHATAEAVAVAEANAVLERQSARPDATSAMLTRVLAKREGAASADVVARARTQRDSLRVAERAARRPAKARPERGAVERMRREGAGPVTDARSAAARLLQRHARAWLRGRRKLRRKERSRAAKRLQRSVRAWLRPQKGVSSPFGARVAGVGECKAEPARSDPAEPPPPAVGEGDDPSCVVCLERPRAVVLLPCRHLSMCALCAAGVSTCPMCRSAVEESMVVFV
jgi:hypothetical protein